MKNKSKVVLPQNWITTKFKYFFETSKGLSITKENLSESGIPVISYGQVHSKYGVKVDSNKDILPFISEDYLKYKQSLLNQGDYIFADTSEDIEGSGNFSTKLNDNSLLFAGYHTIIARLMDKENNDFRYFMYLFASEWFRDQVRNSVSGVKVFSITQAILKNTEVIVPSALTEQKAIADFLDGESVKFDKAAKLISDEIATLKAYKKSLIYEAVTKGLDVGSELKDDSLDYANEINVDWIRTKVKFICSMKSGDFIPAENIEEDGNFPVYGANGLRGFAERYNTDGEFLTVGRQGAWSGNVHYVNGKFWATEHALVTTPKDVNIKFLYFLIETMNLNQYATNAAQPGLAASEILNLPCCIPSNLTEQQKIADYLDEKTKQVDDIITIKEAQLSNLTKQRKGLIYDVVTGKRDV